MESLQLVVDARIPSTKGAARKLRREGKIPAVLYGEGEPKAISVDAREWRNRFRHVGGNTIVGLKLGKDEHRVLIKETQENNLKDRVEHIDFYAIRAGQKLHTQIPVHLLGSPIGVREGGILEQKIDQVEVVCLPKDLPEAFSVDVSNLDVGESIHVRDLDIPEGVEVRTDVQLTLVVVGLPKAAALEEEAAVETEEESDVVEEQVEETSDGETE